MTSQNSTDQPEAQPALAESAGSAKISHASRDMTNPNPQDKPKAETALAASAGSVSVLQQLKWNLWWRGPLHGVICWYLHRCAGAFHHKPYGPSGRYVVLLTDEEYHRCGKLRQTPNDIAHAQPGKS